jgi:hypothetical protein
MGGRDLCQLLMNGLETWNTNVVEDGLSHGFLPPDSHTLTKGGWV